MNNFDDGHISIINGHVKEFSPSWIKSMRMCPERQRQNILKRIDGEPELTTDSTILGSATHKAMEMYLNGASKEDATNGAYECLKTLSEQGLVQLHRNTSSANVLKNLKFFLNDLWCVLDHSEFQDIRVEESFKFEYGGLIFRGTADVIDVSNGRTWDLKGLPLDTPIPTPSGMVNMSDLNVGDIVFDKDGNQCNVIAKSSIHNKPCSQINFKTGKPTIADDDHRWYLTDGSIKTTKELKLKDRIPNGKPCFMEKADLPIRPWLLGYWLGNGRARVGSGNRVRLDSKAEITIGSFKGYSDYTDECKELLGEHTAGEFKRGCTQVSVVGLAHQLRKLNLHQNKHIPDSYIFNTSIAQRKELLSGLLDSDGTYNTLRDQIIWTSSDKALYDSMKILLGSLGIKFGEYFLEKYLNYQLAFTCGFNPFRLPRKAAQWKNPMLSKPGYIQFHVNKITSVESVDSVPTQCIAVDSPSNTYRYGNEWRVTHNTGVFKKEMLWQSQRFDPQPTVYCYHWGTPNFRYAYLGGIAKEVRYDYVDVVREGEGWMDMLVDEVNSWKQATDDFNIDTPWPLSPGDWWCDIAWCQNYDNCMGKHMSIETRKGR